MMDDAMDDQLKEMLSNLSKEELIWLTIFLILLSPDKFNDNSPEDPQNS